MKDSRNPLTGRHCSGYRSIFKVPIIDPHKLFLPIEMKQLPEIRQLLQGISPLVVFNTDSMTEARRAFRLLRKKYDFDYWAIKEYFIRDIDDPDAIIPLRLNDAQFHVINILRKRYFERKIGRYVISKTIRRCGLSTCIQAYILWMQTFQRSNNSYLCGPSEISLMPLKKNLCRYLHRDIVPKKTWVCLPKIGGRALFNTFRSPDSIRGINLGYVHFSDMSRWRDPANIFTSRAYIAPVRAVLLSYFTLIVLEGDVPRKDKFSIREYLRNNPQEKESVRTKKLSRFFSNPFFINELMVSKSYPDPHFFHIHIGSFMLKKVE